MHENLDCSLGKESVLIAEQTSADGYAGNERKAGRGGSGSAGPEASIVLRAKGVKRRLSRRRRC